MGRPTGQTALPMTDTWKAEANAERIRRGLTIKALADLVGTTGPNVSNTLKPIARGGYPTSAYAEAIGRELRVPLPSAPRNDKVEQAARKLSELLSLSEAAFDAEMSHVEDVVAQQRRLIQEIRKPRNKRG